MAQPVLTLANNGDGTASVTISGGTSGTVTVYYAQIGTGWRTDPLSWTSGGTRAGDGSVVVSTGNGLFFFYAVDGSDNAVSVVTQQNIDSGGVPVWEQLIQAVQAKVRTLTTGVSSDRVTRHMIIDGTVVGSLSGDPQILIAPAGPEQLFTGNVSNSRDYHWYPVVIAYASNVRDDTEANRTTWLIVRERLRQAFINQPLGLSSGQIIRCDVQTLDPVNRQWWDDESVVSSQIFKFLSKEVRGSF